VGAWAAPAQTEPQTDRATAASAPAGWSSAPRSTNARLFDMMRDTAVTCFMPALVQRDGSMHITTRQRASTARCNMSLNSSSNASRSSTERCSGTRMCTTGHAARSSILLGTINISCVWDSIHARMDAAERRLLDVTHYTPDALCAAIKKVAGRCMHAQPVLVNGQPLTDQFLAECVERLENVHSTHDGYDMSSCDPLLVLLSSMLGWHIEHSFAGTKVVYSPTRTHTGRVIRLHASRTHQQ
jgi:hypothetical protein